MTNILSVSATRVLLILLGNVNQQGKSTASKRSARKETETNDARPKIKQAPPEV